VPTPTASPTRRPTTEPQPGVAYLPIAMRSVCLARDRARGADVVLVLDTSSSMAGEKLVAAVAAARTFVDAVDPSRDRVGVVTFDVAARLRYLITGDLPAVHRSLDGLGTAQGTRIDLGLEAALEELDRRGREGSRPALVILSDGRPNGGTENLVFAAAGKARARGVTVFAVGLGADVDPHLMSLVATTPANYFAAPTASDLARIYRSVAERLPCR
jgi:Mg-chelatase subunit ChlD